MGCGKRIDLAQKYYEYFVVEDEPIFQGFKFHMQQTEQHMRRIITFLKLC
jgi:hypothetical protein